MNYVEIIERQLELQKELQELQEKRIECAQSHENVFTETETDNVSIQLAIDYESESDMIISLQNKHDSEIINLSVVDFNEINQFLGMYNDAIFSYMNHLTDEDDK